MDTMTCEQFVAWCRKSKQRHIQIIAEWADTMKPDLKTKAQWNVYIKRYIRTAKNLEPFDDDMIKDAFEKMEKAMGEGWLKKPTMETLLKFLI